MILFCFFCFTRLKQMGFLDGAPLISGGVVGGDWARQAKDGQTQTLGRLGERLCWKLGKRGRKQIGNWREAHFVLLDCRGKSFTWWRSFWAEQEQMAPKDKDKDKDKSFTWWRSFWAGEEQMAPRRGRGRRFWGKFQSMAAWDASKQGCILNKKIHTVDARKEETFNKNDMTTAKT